MTKSVVVQRRDTGLIRTSGSFRGTWTMGGMKAEEQVSVVVPVFNEAPVIESVVTDLMTEVADRLPGCEVVVVDDRSTDETPLLLERLATCHPGLRVLRAESNRGHGPTVAAGLDAASHPWVFLMDSDAQFEVADFWKLWAIRKDADLVYGYRDKRADPLHRRLLGRLVRIVVSRLAHQPLSDPNVPFKLLRRSLWLDLRAVVGPDPLAPSIMISLGAALRGWKIKSVAVAHLPRTQGSSTLGAGRLVRFSLAGLRELLAYRNRLKQAPAPEDEQAEKRSTTTA